MNLSDVFVRCLMSEDVDTLFGYPVAAVLSLYESLRASGIHYVIFRYGRAALHASCG